MKIVRKNRPGQPLQPEVDTVSEDERLLNRWYDNLSYKACRHRHSSSFSSSAPLDRQIARILKTLRQRHLWLACECVSGGQTMGDEADSLPSNLPILCPIQLDTWGRRFSFRRIRHTNPHHPDCIFHTPAKLADQFAFECSSTGNDPSINSMTPEDREAKVAPRASVLQPLSGTTSFALDLREPCHHTLVVSVASRSVLSDTRSPRSPARPKLARMMFTLLEEARVHIVRPGWWHRRNLGWQQLHGLQRTRRHIVNRIPLKHYLTTQPTEIAGGCCQLAALAQSEPSDWPPHVKPQAFFAGIATEVDRDLRTIQAVGQSEPLPVEDMPICFVPPGGRASGPFWVFAHIAESWDRSGRYLLRQAYVHPVFSTALLVPVDSHAERQTLDILLAAQRQLDAQGYAIAIAKPLHDFCTRDGDPYRPDFVLYPYRRKQGLQPGACIVVETMGFKDRNYLERKAKTHPRMRELGEVLSWDVRGDMSDGRQRSFQDEAVRACKRLMKPRRRH